MTSTPVWRWFFTIWRHLSMTNISLLWFNCQNSLRRSSCLSKWCGWRQTSPAQAGERSGLWAPESGASLRWEEIYTQYSRLQSCRSYYSRRWLESRSRSPTYGSAAFMASFQENSDANFRKDWTAQVRKQVYVLILCHLMHDPLMQQRDEDETPGCRGRSERRRCRLDQRNRSRPKE